MERYWSLATALFEPLAPQDGYAEEALKKAEEAVGNKLGAPFKIPGPLREVYRRSGRRADLHQRQDPLRAPALKTHRKHLAIREENQGACLYGIPLQEVGKEDPPVFALYSGQSGWRADHDRLSDFLLTSLLWERVNGPPCDVLGVGPGALEKALARGWAPLVIDGVRRPGDWRMFVRGGAAMVVYPDGDGQFTVQVGARTSSLLAAAKEDLGYLPKRSVARVLEVSGATVRFQVAVVQADAAGRSRPFGVSKAIALRYVLDFARANGIGDCPLTRVLEGRDLDEAAERLVTQVELEKKVHEGIAESAFDATLRRTQLRELFFVSTHLPRAVYVARFADVRHLEHLRPLEPWQSPLSGVSPAHAAPW